MHTLIALTPSEVSGILVCVLIFGFAASMMIHKKSESKIRYDNFKAYDEVVDTINERAQTRLKQAIDKHADIVVTPVQSIIINDTTQQLKTIKTFYFAVYKERKENGFETNTYLFEQFDPLVKHCNSVASYNVQYYQLEYKY